jgi:general secretion pathway protein G
MTRTPLPQVSWSERALSCKRHREREGDRGLTLVEVLMIAAIIVTLAALGVPAYSKYRENARVVQAISDLRTMEHDILIQEGYSGKLPASLDEIGKGNLRDPWGNPYQYLNVGLAITGDVRKDHHLNPLNTDFDLYSVGKDGKTKPQINNKDSLDDVVRALNGAYIGLASEF